MSNTLIKRSLLASTILGLSGMVAAPALAQSAGQPVEAQPDVIDSPTTGAIVVTGSRIARPNLEQSSPVTVVDAAEISLSQPISAEEFLRELPGTVPSIGPAVNNGTNGSAQLNLRGLGPNRNLILMNERRVVPATLAGVVDLNIIPVALLERVDVFTGGASSVYGADAVAGVVNFITRRNFAGIDINANYGITERGDGSSYRVDLTTGANFDDGRGNAVLSVSYSNTNPVLQGARAVGTVSRSSATGNPQGSATATPASILFPVVGRFEGGSILTGAANLANYNFNPLNVFQTPLERWSVFGQARYEISPAIEVFTEAFYVNSEVDQQIAPSGSFFTDLQVPLNNQFLTPTQRLQLCQAFFQVPAPTATNANATRNSTPEECAPRIAAGEEVTTQIGRRFTEAGPRRTNYLTHTFQVVAGARGPLTPTLNWEISGQYGESDRQNTSFGQGLRDSLQAGVRGCPAGSPPGCVPINIFGPEGTFTQAMFDFINIPTFAFINTELAAAQATVSGDLGWGSPLAVEPIGVAVGLEYRRYGGSSGGDAVSRTPGAVLGAGAASLPITGEYDAREAFAELVIPLIEDSFIHNFTIEAGARYSDYSTSGGNWTYKVGASLMPIRDIKLRGVYSRAVRAPNIGELFQPQVTFLTNRTTDPCAEGGPVGNAALTARCIAQGATAAQIGNIPQPVAGQINATGGGNPNLLPETATTITAGVVLQPTFLPGTAFTADFFDIKVRDYVSAPSQADVIDACLTGGDLAACALTKRNPLTGGLSGPNDTTPGPFLGSSNLGRLETNGFDFGASFRRDLGFARLNLNGNATWTRKFLFQATPTSINRDCLAHYSVSCDPPLPKWTWNVRTTLSFAQTDVSLLWRHLSSVSVEPPAPNPQLPTGTPTTGGPATVFPAYQRIPSADYFDLSIQHAIADNMRMTLTVQNLLDRDPPDVGNTVGSTTYNSGNTYPTMYDALGRRYTVGVNLRF
ncbi:MAG: TonB-dependent receptor domain-containing protein [Allosphingosinicella sp.]|uniref:TonB-dependent receptor domain-containing protein n=1 Tax=Allosphingosinicella sp. TaxID=2823234 RepID=UPI00394D516D